MAKSRGRGTWTEISGATDARGRMLRDDTATQREGQTRVESWGPGETHFTLNGAVTSPHLLTPFQKKKKKAQGKNEDLRLKVSTSPSTPTPWRASPSISQPAGRGSSTIPRPAGGGRDPDPSGLTALSPRTHSASPSL